MRHAHAAAAANSDFVMAINRRGLPSKPPRLGHSITARSGEPPPQAIVAALLRNARHRVDILLLLFSH
jgi:hypothetical protein